MVKLKVRKVSRSEWREFAQSNRKRELKKVVGGVGYSGQKIHAVMIEYIPTKEGIVVIHAVNSCGSGTQHSVAIPYYDTDLSKVNCKRCRKYIK